MNTLLVGLGGALGAIARYLLSCVTHPVLAVFAMNVVGAFLLGVLTAMAAGKWRLFLGTGLLGGFTTYSALAVDTVRLLHDDVVAGLLYATGSVAVGLLTAWGGLTVGHMLADKRKEDRWS